MKKFLDGLTITMTFAAFSALLLAMLVAGCTSFSNHVFRTEQTSVHLAYGAYVGYTNALPQLHISPQASNDVKEARLQFAATVQVIDGLRVAYETNSAVKPQLEATLLTLADQSSNLVWLVHYVTGR
jgi:hypothetical protein